MEPDRPQHDYLAACVIAQQHSFAVFISLGSMFTTKILSRILRMLYLKSLNLKLPNLKLRKTGVCLPGGTRYGIAVGPSTSYLHFWLLFYVRHALLT